MFGSLKKPRKRVIAGVAAILLIPALTWWALIQFRIAPEPGEPLAPPFNLSDRLATLEIEEGEEGLQVVFPDKEGQPFVYESEDFLREVRKRQEEKKKWGWLFRKLDITGWASLAWVGFGFLAQGVFMSRLMVQWYASEKAKASVVPPVFWWLSLLGASMLIVYYIWRKDPVSILAQSFGWTIYVRNLWFIHAESARRAEPAD